MIIRDNADINCPICGKRAVKVFDVPSQASINAMLPPDMRPPVPADDRWRVIALGPCGACGAQTPEIQLKLDEPARK